MAIISHQHKFIFIKTRKTAGTSVEIALSRYCGPNDVITPISGSDEAKRLELGYAGPQNHIVPFSRYGLKDWGRLLLRRKRMSFRNHMWAYDIKRMVGPDVWNSYYKFCFERNPWDKAISGYYWASRKKTENRDLEDFMLQGGFQDYRSYDQYTIDGECVVDDIYRFEEMDDALQHIAERVGLPGPLELPVTKSATRKDRRPYYEVLSEEAADAISRGSAPEIELLSYRFQPAEDV